MRDLWTEEGERLTGSENGVAVPWDVYPRPQMKRKEWLNLNGEWEFCVSRGTEEPAFDRTIRVPFCPESLLSGIHERAEELQTLCYRRTWTVPESWTGKGKRILLHFGAADQYAVVSCNGRVCGVHKGGYLPFSFDITDLVRRINVLEVRVSDPLSPLEPWGKQKKKNGGMWYTPVSGIWQTVWAEPVPENHLTGLTIETTDEEAVIRPEGIKTGTLECGEKTFPLAEGAFRVRPDDVRLWSPEHPNLYRFVIRSGADEVESYFALRTLSVRSEDGSARLCLNGKPYFFHGLLDQGYWSDGLYTPASPDLFRKDILFAKKAGFNMLRKHIKVEPEVFYSLCDELGMAVFQDCVNNGTYSFLRDSLLPTLGLQRANDRRRNRDARARENFEQHMLDTVRHLRNHPCICLWTIFNEGWGQFCADDMYEKLKALDGSRFVDSTSGWFAQEKSDVESVHIYFKRLRVEPSDRPRILSEYGGYAMTDSEHSFRPEKSYGYRKFRTKKDLTDGIRNLMEAELLPLAEAGLSAAVYTQLSDVEEETNGLLTFDRRREKVRPEDLRVLSGRLTGRNETRKQETETAGKTVSE
ncbi:MAG: glycoside hydrolase family 2 [Clostridia bacterium]|nr:glycoside hydrolase family 2 [Clostridia bacterium]